MRLLVLSSLVVIAVALAAHADTPSAESYRGMDELLGGTSSDEDRAGGLLETNVPTLIGTTAMPAPAADIRAALNAAQFVDETTGTATRPAAPTPKTKNGRPLLNWDGRSF